MGWHEKRSRSVISLSQKGINYIFTKRSRPQSGGKTAIRYSNGQRNVYLVMEKSA